MSPWWSSAEASIGLLELTALPSIPRVRWEPWVRRVDVILASGGDALYLAHWMRESGLADLLPLLEDTVWVGMSAGSMVMAPRVGDACIQWRPPGLEDRALGLVDFAICPHVNGSERPGNSGDQAARWAASMVCTAYAIDDETAISVDGDHVEVVSEGLWQRFPD